MAYTDAQGRPELIAGAFVKKGTGSATVRQEQDKRGDAAGRDSRSETGQQNQRKPAARR